MLTAAGFHTKSQTAQMFRLLVLGAKCVSVRSPWHESVWTTTAAHNPVCRSSQVQGFVSEMLMIGSIWCVQGKINRCCFVTTACCCGMSYTLKHHASACALLTFCSLINCLLRRSSVKVYSVCLCLSLLWHFWCQTKDSWNESKLLLWHLLICFISLQSKWQIKLCSCGTSAWLTRQLVFMARSGNGAVVVVKI